MPTRLVHLVVDADDPFRLGQFWAAALGWEMAEEEPGEVDVWPAGFNYPDPVALPLVFVPVPSQAAGKNRVHLDLASTSAEHQADLVERLRGLGATSADVGQGDVPWVVLADPEGNELCVLEPRPVYRDTGPIAAVVVGCADPRPLARFWAQAAGWPCERASADIAALRTAGDVGPYLELLRSDDPKTGKNRIHFDVAPYRGDDHAAEVTRLRQLGATPVNVGQDKVPWEVLADPEGNELCVLAPR
jgi:predicted enzyme related to lactoylglutathione lyase